MISNSKSSSVNANASDGGYLGFGGIGPLTINSTDGPESGGLNTRTMLLIALGVVGALVGLFIIFRK